MSDLLQTAGEQTSEALTEKSKHLWDEAVRYDRIVNTGLMPDGTKASKTAINKAKKMRRQCKRDSEDAANDARKAAKREKELEFRASIAGDKVVDKDGNVVRPYSLAERFLDNKVLSWGTVIAFLVAMLILTYVIGMGNW